MRKKNKKRFQKKEKKNPVIGRAKRQTAQTVPFYGGLFPKLPVTDASTG